MKFVFNPGDVLLPGAPAGKRGYISNKILESTQSGPEEPSRASHSMIVSKGGTFDEAYVIEQTFPYMREVKLVDHYSKSFVVCYRAERISPDAVSRMLEHLRARVQKKELYALGKIFTLWLDSILCDIVSFFRAKKTEIRLFSKIKITNLEVCSFMVVNALYRFTGLFNSESTWTPDDIDDHCKASSEWQLMGEFTNGRARCTAVF